MPSAPLALIVDSQFTSPYAMSAFVALQEKGLAFDLQTVNLEAGQQHSPAFRQQSRTSRVPTLVQGEFSLSESSAITEYLEDLYPAPSHARLYPADLQQRARARQVQAWLRSDLLALRIERTTAVIFLSPNPAPLSAEGQAAADKLIQVAEGLLPSGAEHLFGAWCLADTDLALMLNRLALNGDALPERLKTYAQQQWQRPSVQQWVKQPRS
nr:glutathione transferase [uncultured Roseateles sp.]